MQITINVPDTLPAEFLKLRVQELEQNLISEAKFFNSILTLNLLSQFLAKNIINDFLTKSRLTLSYDGNGKLQGSFSHVFNHQGLYAFILQKSNTCGIAYIGKSESDKDDRLRQHLTGENKDGSLLSDSVNTKHSNIISAVNAGFNVELALFNDSSLIKSSFSCLEIESIQLGQINLKTNFPNVTSWNLRIG